MTLRVGQLAMLNRNVGSTHVYCIEWWRTTWRLNNDRKNYEMPVDKITRGETVLVLETDASICRIITPRSKIGWVPIDLFDSVL